MMKKGFTLIELVVIMGLFAIVSAVGMSFLIASKENFQRSQDASEIHYQVRRATDYVRDEVRNATSISLESIPAIPDPLYDYLYVRNNVLIHVVSGAESDKTMDILVDDANMFSITQNDNGNNIITYTINATISSSVGDRDYSAPTSIHLNNIRELLGDKGSVYAPMTGPCIKYQKPIPTP
jgi:prepilin-type N-terminal cleavage/methylation domain-containing protein